MHWPDILDFLIKLFNEKTAITKNHWNISSDMPGNAYTHTNVGKTRNELSSNVLLYPIQCGFPCDASREVT